MGLFGSKKNIYFDVLEKEISKNTKKILDLELEIEKFRTQLISLRGLVNRKLSKEAGEIETKEFKSIDGLDSLR